MELNERGGVIREDCDPGCGGPLPGLSARDALHPAKQELVFLDKDSTEAEILAAGADAEVLFVDAITVVSARSDGTHALPAADSLGGGGV